MSDKIDSFTGEFEFLANPYPAALIVDGELYPSVEHALQAKKTDDPTEKKSIREAATASDAKNLGRKATLIPDWDQRRLDFAASLIQQKFTDHLDLKIKLLMTGDRELIAGGMRKDQFWGVTKDGVGENHLGKILMSVRDKIRAHEGSAQDVFFTLLNDRGLGFLVDDLKEIQNIAKMVVDKNVDLDQNQFDVEKAATFIKSFT